MKKPSKYEILAPCGNLDTVLGAAAVGCDSIYLGAKAYNARACAENFENAMIDKVIHYCHRLGIKVFITFNILYKESETEDVLKLASELYSYGADAFICADIGIMNIFKEYFRGININVSTQATVHNSDTALCYKAMGIDRIVLSRELSLENIKAVYNKVGEKPELEAFVHGALCVCYSGRCLYSSFVGGRSGNRGQCAQPCRMEYALLKDGREIIKGALLSPKDIMTAEHIYDMIKAGVKAFKIEGRMKGVPYVVQTVKTYKKYLIGALSSKADSKITKEDKNNLLQVFSRGGVFSEGYLYSRKGRDMLSESVKNTGREIGVVADSNQKGCYIKFFEDVHCGDGIEISGRNIGCGISKEIRKNQTVFFNKQGKKGDRVFLSSDKALFKSLEGEALNERRKREIEAEFTAKAGEKTELTLKAYEAEIRVSGEEAQKAEHRPTTKEEIIKQLSKTGNTPFKITGLNTDIDEDIYIPVKEINALRRRACEELSSKITEYYKREKPFIPPKPVLEKPAEKPFISAEVTALSQLRAVLKTDIKRIYINDIKLIKEALTGGNREVFYALPHIIREESLEKVFEDAEQLEKTKIAGFLTRNLTMLKTNKKIICDHTLGVFNSYTEERLLRDYTGITLSTELNVKELKPLCVKNSEIIVYGRLPLMSTEQCPIGNFAGNNRGKRFCSLKNKAEGFTLKDRVGAIYPLEPCCEHCFCKILSNEPVFAKDALRLNPSSFRLIFTTETEKETAEILNYFTAAINNPDNIKPTDIKGRPLKGVR